jgi:Na+:H+ antiporter, NhaA family
MVLPVFALANAGVPLSGQTVRESITHPVALGVILGLVFGKPLGIVSAAVLAVRSGRARLPSDVGWKQLAAGSALGGVGFTVAIFIAGLAFTEQHLADVAKVGILLASVLASLIGAGALLFACRPGPSSGALRRHPSASIRLPKGT